MSDTDPSLPTPPSPSSTATDKDEPLEEIPSKRLRLELAPFGLEHLLDYEPGGHHPVHLGDVLGNKQRYRIVHKLGSGGFANIWLCRNLAVHDTTKYVALKILIAELSTDDCPELLVNSTFSPDDDGGANYIAHALDYFKIHGPNGSHLCLVYPVLGPKVSLGLHEPPPNHDKILRRICHQVVEAVDCLHTHGVCHGGTCSCIAK